MSVCDLQKKLSCSPLLEGVPLREQDVLEKRFSAGQIIGDHLGEMPAVGLILSGRVEVYSVALDGKDVQLNTLAVGECFGISNLFSDMALETVLRCAEATRILYISKAALRSLMERDPALALRYADVCNRKIQFLLRRIELLTMQSCRGRVIAFLLARQDTQGVVQLSGSRENLACQLGVSRAALFRELSSLQAQGWIRAEGSRITVCSRTGLEELLSGG